MKFLAVLKNLKTKHSKNEGESRLVVSAVFLGLYWPIVYLVSGWFFSNYSLKASGCIITGALALLAWFALLPVINDRYLKPTHWVEEVLNFAVMIAGGTMLGYILTMLLYILINLILYN